jgi:hypothetical protein
MPVLLVAAGLSLRSATAIASDLSNLASEIPDELPTLSNIYGRRARQLTWRTVAVNTPGLPFEFSAPRFVPRGSPPLVFVFSGQGPQHIESAFLANAFFQTTISDERWNFSGAPAFQGVRRIP